MTKLTTKLLSLLVDSQSGVNLENIPKALKKSLETCISEGLVSVDDLEGTVTLSPSGEKHLIDLNRESVDDSPAASDDKESQKANEDRPKYWFDDGQDPITCCRDYPSGESCEFLNLGIFGKKSKCSKHGCHLDSLEEGFTPTTKCANDRAAFAVNEDG